MEIYFEQSLKKRLLNLSGIGELFLHLIVIPLLIFPALFIAFPLLLQSEAAELDALELDVTWQGDVNEDLHSIFNDSKLMISFEEIPDDAQ